jgi:hypothetical protein
MADKEFNLVGVLKANTANFERGLDKAKGKNSKFNKSINKTKALSSAAGNQLNAMTGGAIGGFTGMFNAIKTSITGLRGFKLALASTGIGLLIIALGSLITYFKDSAEGQETMNRLLGGFKGIIGFVQSALESFGKLLVDVWINPKKYLNEFIDSIKNQLFNRIKGVGDYFVILKDIASNTFSYLSAKVKGFFTTDGDVKAQMKKQAEEAAKGIEEGLKGAGDATLTIATGLNKEQRKQAVDDAKNLGKDISNAWNEGYNEGEAKNAFLEQTRQAKKYQAEQQKIIKANVLKSRELEKYSAEERMGFIEEAKKANESLYASKLALQQEELRMHRAQMALSPTNQDDLDKEAELEQAVLNIQTQQISAAKELQNRVNTLNTELDKEVELRQKAIDKVLTLNQELQNITYGSELDNQYDFITPLEAYEEKLSELKQKQKDAFSPEEYQKLGAEINAVEGKISEFKGEGESATDAISGKMEGLAGSLSDGFMTFFDDAEKGWDSMGEAVKNFANTVIQQLIGKGILKLLSMLIPGTSFVGGLLGFSDGGTVPKFATGGIVSGSSTIGDNVLARVNSGEMILNDKQQSNLFRMLDKGGNNSSGTQQVEFRLKGTELIGAINNVNRRNKTIR